MTSFCRYDDPKIRRRLCVHQRCLRTFTCVPLSLGGFVRPGANGKRDHGPHVRTIHITTRMAWMRTAVRSGAIARCRDHM